MEYILAAVLLIVVLAALAYPLYRPRGREGFVSGGADTLAELLAHRDRLYATLSDLQGDFEQGKLDAADYARLRARYMERAAQVLQRLDTIQADTTQTGNEQSQAIEREVLAMRSRRNRVPVLQPAGVTPNGSAPEGGLLCPNCHRAYQPGDRFCAGCGAALQGEAA